MSFKNKVVLVTGASSGIGAATAIKFAKEGAQVAISSLGRQTEKICSVAKEIEATGTEPLVILGDVTKDDDLKKIVCDTLNKFCKLDVLVNNAGFLSLDGILTENVMDTYDKLISTNLRSAIYMTHLCAPYLIQTKGNIVNISSIVALRIILEDCFAYNTSKAGMSHFTRSVALELGPKGVRVNNVNPGLVKTDIAENMGMSKADEEAFWKEWARNAPLGKIAMPDEIAELVAFIAGEKGKSITGSSFVLDNGELLVPTGGRKAMKNCSCS